jgi:two-component system, OmpR family, sensor histidine kinase BaeS
MSFKLRMSFLVATLISVTIGTFTAVLIRGEGKALAASLEARRKETTLSFSDVCRDAIVSEQFVFLSNYVRALAKNPELIEAACVDADRRAVGHTTPALTFTPLSPETARAPLETKGFSITEKNPDTMEALAPVEFSSKRLGGVRVLFSRREADRRFREDLAKARKRLLALALAVLGTGFLGAFLATAAALKPLGRLVEGTRLFGAGRWDHRIPADRKDELGVLAGEFNHMAEKLKELDRMKEDFVSGVTHDLKSPVGTVRMNLEVIEKEAAKRGMDVLADPLFVSRRAIDRLGHLITSLLDVAKIESALKLDLKEVDLEDLAQRVVESYALIAKHKGLALDLVVETALRPIQGDPVKLERVLSNLVGNAVKYTDQGSVRVMLAERDGVQELRVADTGKGIPSEDMERLFSKFFRVAGKSAEKEGAGLGLSIVKALVEAHGGTVAAASETDRGSTFTVRFPVPGENPR